MLHYSVFHYNSRSILLEAGQAAVLLQPQLQCLVLTLQGL
jgi:hypothetical protein